ncbi:MAG: radical SAM protein [Spirochaetales bacterium]|jgi:predicted DNA-binding helix-hairpin-helix protein|nr:radical SAM protein [Spirochaetales bacterium]
MDTQEKLDILSRDAQYDLSCACGTKNSDEHRKKNHTGDGWLYPTTTASGGSGIILKTLMGNRCANDCKYCPLREEKDFRPVALSPYEMASFFFEYQLKRPLIGIFLSSAVLGDGEKTMEMLVSTAEILRKHFRYRGYIHLKIIPGSSRASIESALSYASAVSLNVETPGAKHFSRLTDKKEYQKDIIDPLTFIAEQTARGGRFSRVSTSSQFIVGASDESDQEILSYGSRMYSNLQMGRLYFSAYQGGLGDPSIPGEQKREVKTEQPTLFDLGPQVGTSADALMREHRLYQADWLLRKYGFAYEDLVFGESGNLNLQKDPKLIWAESHPDRFPVSVKRASKEQLLKVPGIGPSFAERIVQGRGACALSSLEDLRLPAATLRKARTFLEM